MGCAGSAATGQASAAEDKRRMIQPKIPILLFYLPGPAKETLARIVLSHGEARSKKEANDESINIRFIDAQNTRNARRYWVKELQNRSDFAAAFYIADVRDHPGLLLAARTGNWFLRLALKTYELKVIVIYDEESQLEEFKSYIPDSIEIIKLCETNPELVAAAVELFRNLEHRYTEQKRHQAPSKSITKS